MYNLLFRYNLWKRYNKKLTLSNKNNLYISYDQIGNHCGQKDLKIP